MRIINTNLILNKVFLSRLSLISSSNKKSHKVNFADIIKNKSEKNQELLENHSNKLSSLIPGQFLSIISKLAGIKQKLEINNTDKITEIKEKDITDENILETIENLIPYLEDLSDEDLTDEKNKFISLNNSFNLNTDNLAELKKQYKRLKTVIVSRQQDKKLPTGKSIRDILDSAGKKSREECIKREKTLLPAKLKKLNYNKFKIVKAPSGSVSTDSTGRKSDSPSETSEIIKYTALEKNSNKIIIKTENRNKRNTRNIPGQTGVDTLIKQNDLRPVKRTEVKSGGGDSKAIIKQISEKIHLRHFSDTNKIQIKLKPEYLGKIDIKLIVDKGEIVARVMVENSFVKNQLEDNISVLKNNLFHQGINIEEIHIESGREGADLQQQSSHGSAYGERENQYNKQQEFYFDKRHSPPEFSAEDDEGSENTDPLENKWYVMGYHYRGFELHA